MTSRRAATSRPASKSAAVRPKAGAARRPAVPKGAARARRPAEGSGHGKPPATPDAPYTSIAVELRDAIALIAELVGDPVTVEHRATVAGEAWRTACEGTLARRELGFVPQTPLGAGIARQFEHMLEITRRAPRRNKIAGRQSVVQVEVTDGSTTRIRGTGKLPLRN